MKPALVLFLGLAAQPAFALQVSAAFAEYCETNLPATQIEVVSEAPALVYDFSKSVRDLTQRKSFGARALTLGLTERKLVTELQINSPSKSHRWEPVMCTRPSVTVTLSLAPHTVFVGTEFPQDGCAFSAILKHEQRHVSVNNMALKNTAERLTRELRASLGNRVYYGQRAELEAAISRQTRDWQVWVESEIAKVDRLHDSIDTPDEHARNDTLCGGEIPLALKAAGLR